MKKFILLIFLLPVLLTSCVDEVTIPTNSYKSNFEALWKIIDTKYCFLETKHINWDSIHTVYSKSLILDTLNHLRFFDAMENMLDNLKDGHVNLYSDFDVSRYSKWYTDYPANFDANLIRTSRYLGANYRSVNGLRYNKIAGERVGYLYYGSFSDSFSTDNMRAVFDSFEGCRGLIIDVRNNGGGSVDQAELLASYFFKMDNVTMFIKHKTGPGHNDFSQPYAFMTKASTTLQWTKPVVVLTNRMSYSATNMFVCQMRRAPKCTVIGDITGGGAGIPMSDELPSGWMIRYSSSPTYDYDMNDIEQGIPPHIRMNLDVDKAKDGIDTMIEKGIEVIESQL